MKELILILGSLIILTGCNQIGFDKLAQIKETKLTSDKEIGDIEEWSCKNPKSIIKKVRIYQTECPERDEVVLDSCGYKGQINAYICDSEYFLGDDTDIYGEIVYGPFKFKD